MTKQYCVWLLVLHFILTGVAIATTPAHPRVLLYTENMPPFSYLRNNQPDGINVALIKQLCARLQYDCIISLMPWRRAFEKAQAHQLSGVFSTARTASREALFKWVGPIAIADAYLFKLKSRHDVNPANLDEAKQYKIAVARGDVFEEYLHRYGFEHNSNMILFADKAEAVPLLQAKRIDLLVGLSMSVKSWLHQHGLPFTAVEPVVALGEVSKVYLALNNQFPEAMAQQMQTEVELMLQQGVLDTLLQQYAVSP